MTDKFCLLTALLLLVVALCPAQVLDAGFGPPPGKRANLGVGFGFPYGGIGVAADVYFIDNLATTLAVGTLGYTAGYEIGAKYLFGSSQKTWRPEIIVLFGVNSVIWADGTAIGDIHEIYRGLTVGAGSQFMFGKKRKHGFDAGVTYVLTSGMYKRIEELQNDNVYLTSSSRFKVFFGYRFAFDLKF